VNQSLPLQPLMAPRTALIHGSKLPDLSRFQTNCCIKSSVGADLQFRQMNLFDCASLRSFSPARRGEQEVCDDWYGYGSYGPGERSDLSGPCIRRLSLQGLKLEMGLSRKRHQAPKRRDASPLSQEACSESFNELGRASDVAGVSCAITIWSPTDFSH